MAANSSVTIRRARRDDVPVIVAMLADDPLGSGRERIEDPLPPSYFQAFEAVDRDRNIQLVVAEAGDGEVVGCLQLCILPGLSSQGASRGLIEDVRVASPAPQPGHRRATGTVGGGRGPRKGCRLVELLTHNTRVEPSGFMPARISAEPCRHDRAVLTPPDRSSPIRVAPFRFHCKMRFAIFHSG